MKRNDFINEIKGLSVTELTERARSMTEEMMKLRFRKVTGQLEQSHRLGQIRRDLARVQTFISKAKAANG
jgi:large subunit ribosomal protein L29